MDMKRARGMPFYRWSAKIQKDTLPDLQELAASLGFIVTTPGRHDGDASPPKLLDSLAAAYRRDPDGVRMALKVLGVIAEKPTE